MTSVVTGVGYDAESANEVSERHLRICTLLQTGRKSCVAATRCSTMIYLLRQNAFSLDTPTNPTLECDNQRTRRNHSCGRPRGRTPHPGPAPPTAKGPHGT